MKQNERVISNKDGGVIGRDNQHDHADKVKKMISMMILMMVMVLV